MAENKDPNAFTAADKPPTHEETLSSLHGATPPADDTEGEDETHFVGRPLHEFDGMDDATLLQQDGVGEATAKKIRAAQRKRDRAK
jgi:hypothetical protein